MFALLILCQIPLPPALPQLPAPVSFEITQQPKPASLAELPAAQVAEPDAPLVDAGSRSAGGVLNIHVGSGEAAKIEAEAQGQGRAGRGLRQSGSTPLSNASPAAFVATMNRPLAAFCGPAGCQQPAVSEPRRYQSRPVRRWLLGRR